MGAAVVTTAPRTLSTEAAAPKVKIPKVKVPKEPKEPKMPKQKIVKEGVIIKVAEGETAYQPDLVDGIEQLTGLPRSHVLSFLIALPEVVTANVAAGKDVRISGLGTVKKVTLKAKTFRNIHTGEPIPMPDREGVKIRVAVGLKKATQK
eukprot:GDKK01047495.1.p1 GENE.GDKK01047495.1~~GDKK01047495.1.p1  ORF type:complete len:149 (+),score=30.15 GDKK01047495.1:1-447(+)